MIECYKAPPVLLRTNADATNPPPARLRSASMTSNRDGVIPTPPAILLRPSAANVGPTPPRQNLTANASKWRRGVLRTFSSVIVPVSRKRS